MRHKNLWDFEIQTDYPITVRRLDLVPTHICPSLYIYIYIYIYILICHHKTLKIITLLYGNKFFEVYDLNLFIYLFIFHFDNLVNRVEL